MRATRRLLLCAWIGMMSVPGWAQPRPDGEPLVIVSSDDTSAYAEAAQAALGELVRSGVPRYDIRLMTASELAQAVQAGRAPQPRVFLALGSLAAETLASDAGGMLTAPVLSALIPRTSFEHIALRRNTKSAPRWSAIYLDQPLRRQLALIRLVWPQAQRLGVLWGAESQSRAPALRALAQAAGLTLVEAQADGPGGLFPAIKRVVDGSEVLLALPDPQVYNSASISHILLAAMRQQLPMVAFSPAYVRAGALLALYQTPTQAGLQAAAILNEVLHGKPLPATAQESADFEIGVNTHVANALKLQLDAPSLRLVLRRQEQLP